MKKLNIIYEDKNLLVIDKPPKQLTIKTNKNEIPKSITPLENVAVSTNLAPASAEL